jgi:thiol-disulfide isomerase/thioredoxin
VSAWTGRGVLGLFAALFALNAAWVFGHCEELRPIGRGDPAPEVTLARIDGQGPRSLASLRGKVVLIDFWATWCGPCEKSMPVLKKMYAKHAEEGFDVLSINEDAGSDAIEAAKRYVASHGLPWPVVHDDGSAAEAYKVDVYPTMLLVDKKGVVRQVEIGLTTAGGLEDDLDSGITRLLKE